MTTILAKRYSGAGKTILGEVWSDSLSTAGKVIHSTTQSKLFKIYGLLVATSGSAAGADLFRDHLEEQAGGSKSGEIKGSYKEIFGLLKEVWNQSIDGLNHNLLAEGPDSSPDLYNLIISSKGIYSTYGITLQRLQDNQWWAMGTGGNYALAALKAGAGPEEAIQIASEIDIYTGSDIKRKEIVYYV